MSASDQAVQASWRMSAVAKAFLAQRRMTLFSGVEDTISLRSIITSVDHHLCRALRVEHYKELWPFVVPPPRWSGTHPRDPARGRAVPLPRAKSARALPLAARRGSAATSERARRVHPVAGPERLLAGSWTSPCSPSWIPGFLGSLRHRMRWAFHRPSTDIMSACFDLAIEASSAVVLLHAAIIHSWSLPTMSVPPRTGGTASRGRGGK